MRRRALVFVVLASLLVALPASAGAPSTVTAHTDEYGIPHVVAGSREAMAYGMGYVTARDRLFETDIIRRLGQGRLSEVLGPGRNDSQLIADMAMRREFFDPANIDEQLAALPSEMRTLLDAYAAGFNVAMAKQLADPSQVPALFGALGYVPEPWRPQDSITVMMLFSIVTFAGEGAGGELENAQMLDRLVDRTGDPEDALEIWNDLLLRNDPAAPAIVPHGEGPPAPFVSASSPDPVQTRLARAPGIAAAAKAEAEESAVLRRVLSTLPFPKIGSYMVAATGERTASGRGLLLGAPQAGFLAPSVFYEIGLHAPGIDCSGFTVPGLGPFMGIGWCNGHAWSFVAGNAGDQVDLVAERLCDRGAGYEYDGACKPFGTRVERYVVKSTVEQKPPRVEQQTILSTMHGPVFRVDEAAGYAYVFRRAQAGVWSRTFLGLYALTSAQSFEELEHGMRHTTATYNMLYADDAGTIAYRFTGYQPVRAATIDHRLPTPGWSSAYEWQARTLPYEAMPHVTNPARGYLVSNQGVDSKPISWWPRSSRVSIARFGHTAADTETFASETGLTIERLKQLNRLIISDRDNLIPRLERVVDEALATEDPSSRLGRAYALFDQWRQHGYPRTRQGTNVKEPQVTIFGADRLNFPASDVWERFMAKVWAPAGEGMHAGYIGRVGQTLALIEDPQLFSRNYAGDWRAAFRSALGERLDALTAQYGTEDMTAWLSVAPVIKFSEVGLLKPREMHVVDHGTYSQIVDLGAHAGVNIMPPGNGRADRVSDVALHTVDRRLPDDFVDQLELYEQFEFKAMKMAPSEYARNTQSTEVLVYAG